VLVPLLYVTEGAAMSFFFNKGEKIEAVLFSPLEGVITYEGQPASGAQIKRKVAWKDKEGEIDYFTTDEKGYFSIPIKTIEYRDSAFARLSIGQTITVEFKGKEHIIWKTGKTSAHLYGELGGRPVNLVCELTKEKPDFHLEFELVETLCVWSELDQSEVGQNELE